MMKLNKTLHNRLGPASVITAWLLFCPIPAEAGEASGGMAIEPSTYARFVPERKDDFAWENDLIAFRAYGPAVRKGKEDSGIDVWCKRVPYPIIDRWYANESGGKSYHADHGEGADIYQVGSSRGCGGTSLWKNERLVTSDTYTAWRILEQTRDRTVFELDYIYPAEAGETPITEVKRIEIRLGQRFFRSESRFTRDGKPVADLPVALGLTTHDGRGLATFKPEARWMGVWEKMGANALGTGVVLATGYQVEPREIKSSAKDESHALLLTRTDADGRVVAFIGYGWSKAGTVTAPEDWFALLDARASAP